MAFQQIAVRWWILAVRGLLSLVFGVLLMVLPGITLFHVLLLFTWYAIADGVALIMISDLGEGRWWAAFLNGIVSVVAGVGASLAAKIGPSPLLYFIIGWAIMRSILEIASGIRLRQDLRCVWLVILAGVLSLGFGTIVLSSSIRFAGRPIITTLVETLWTALYTCALGLLLLLLAFRLRSLRAVRPAVAA